MTLTSQTVTKARVSSRPCMRKKVSTIWIDRATDPPIRNILLKTEATAALKDFNAVARYWLTLPSKNCCASPLVEAAGGLSPSRKKSSSR